MLVLHPRMSTDTDFTNVEVSVRGIGATSVEVGDGISVYMGVKGVIMIMPGVIVKGRVRIIGVAVIIPGVLDEIGVKTGKG